VAIVVTVVTGLVQTVRLDGGDLFGSSHGRVLLLKTVAVAVMLFIAIKARQFVNERLARADEMTVPMADRLRRAFGIEAAIGILAVASSAWMLALTPPNVDAGNDISYAIERQFARFTGSGVLEYCRRHDFLAFEERNSFRLRMRLAFDINDSGVELELDFWIVLRALEHDFGSAELLAPMH
jgi:hypothetical protein